LLNASRMMKMLWLSSRSRCVMRCLHPLCGGFVI
jgi:hypothetical protein